MHPAPGTSVDKINGVPSYRDVLFKMTDELVPNFLVSLAGSVSRTIGYLFHDKKYFRGFINHAAVINYRLQTVSHIFFILSQLFRNSFV